MHSRTRRSGLKLPTLLGCWLLRSQTHGCLRMRHASTPSSHGGLCRRSGISTPIGWSESRVGSLAVPPLIWLLPPMLTDEDAHGRTPTYRCNNHAWGYIFGLPPCLYLHFTAATHLCQTSFERGITISSNSFPSPVNGRDHFLMCRQARLPGTV